MRNPYIEGLVKRLDNRYAVDRADMSMSAWIEANTRLRKKPFTFRGYEFQRAIVDDMHPNMDVIKCSQVGLTEGQLRKALGFVVRNNGTRAIFTLPTDAMFKRISKTRIQPVVEGSPVFNPEGSGEWTRSMDLMQFDQSFLYVTGAKENDATSIDADAVFNDEVDLTNKQMLALFNSRLQNSSWRIRQRFSTPTHVGFGIDKTFSVSDQHEYLCRCPSCRYVENIPDFTRDYIEIPGLPDHIEDLSQIDDKLVDKLDLQNAIVKCKRCGAPLDLDNPDMRLWVPRYPEKSQIARGYYVRPFVTSKLDVQYIVQQLLEYKRLDFLRGWHNTVLGKAFTDSNARLSEVEIRANMVSPTPIEISPSDPVFIGIDVGLVCHVTIGKMTPEGLVVCRFLTVSAEEIEAWVADFAETHNLIGGAMDRLPFTPTANAVFEASKGKVFPVQYTGHREISPQKNPEGDVIYFHANRTQIIDEVVKRIRKRKLPMAGYDYFEHVVIEHLRDMVRDESPEKEAQWVKLNGNDHYFHSLGFLLFATRILSVLELLNDADPRQMVAIVGIDMKMPSDVLSGTTKRPREDLYGDFMPQYRRRF